MYTIFGRLPGPLVITDYQHEVALVNYIYLRSIFGLNIEAKHSKPIIVMGRKTQRGSKMQNVKLGMFINVWSKNM